MAKKDLDTFEQLCEDMSRRYAEWEAQQPEAKEKEVAARKARKEGQYLKQNKQTDSNADATLSTRQRGEDGEGEEIAGANEQLVVQSQPKTKMINLVAGDIYRSEPSHTDPSATAPIVANSQKITGSEEAGAARADGSMQAQHGPRSPQQRALERHMRMEYLAQRSDLNDAEAEEFLRYLEEESMDDYQNCKIQKQMENQAAERAQQEEQMAQGFQKLAVDEGAAKTGRHKRERSDEGAEGMDGVSRTDGQRARKKRKERQMFETGDRRAKESKKTGAVADMMATMAIDDAGAHGVRLGSQAQRRSISRRETMNERLEQPKPQPSDSLPRMKPVEEIKKEQF